jgi:hypothetical protein
MNEHEGRDNSRERQQDMAIIPGPDPENGGRKQIREGRNAGGNTDEEASYPAHSSRFQMFMHRHFPDAKAHDRWQLVFTFVIAVSTFFYTIFAGWTLHEIHSGSADTHNLAVAAANQASHTEEIAQAAQDQVDAANEISDAADSFSETAEVAVEEFRRAAGDSAAASKQSAANAERTIKNAQQSFREEQRAWVGIAGQGVSQFEPKKPIILFADFGNSGRTPARNVMTRTASMLIDARSPILGPNTEHIRMLRQSTPQSGPAIAPQARYSLTIGRDNPPDDTEGMKRARENIFANFDQIKSKALILYVFGEISYDDISGRPHVTRFCLFLTDPEAKTVTFCPQFNDVQ